jgi:predicted secreted hydrolase
MKRLLVLILVAVLIVAGYFWRQSTGEGADAQAASLIPLLAEENTAGFAQATEANNIVFPRDLGPHDEYQTEWWYYTGNLETAEGRPFGFQLTFFRRALTQEGASGQGASEQEASGQEAGGQGASGQGASGQEASGQGASEQEASGQEASGQEAGGQGATGQEAGGQGASGQEAESSWRTNQVYLAHFTISDIEGDAFYPAERFSRGAAGLAGAEAAPYRVWLENWFVEETDSGEAHLFAQTEQVTLDLTLSQTLPPILHGDGGLSPKGPERGNASYYYSIIRQEAAGRVVVGDESFEVNGLAWKDHEYSTSALTLEAVGWDWFSLQFDDGSALMFFQIRRADGRLEPASSGTFIYSDGTTQALARDEWQMRVTDSWVSPNNGAEYPAGWEIEIAVLDLAIEGRPLIANQELTVSTTYWEGAVEFSGAVGGHGVEGRGYIELTGYAETMRGRL